MDDRILGAGILLGSLLGIGIYFWLVFLSPWTVQVVQASAFIAATAILTILAWIGYTLATTPPPKPIEEIERELGEVEEDSEPEQAYGSAQEGQKRLKK
ncbi:MAG: transcriptional regulator [Candidatus Brockarchaeota archaeon]|nr:transcriptional regulator [Candidatus Brockarchaeota archaeon]